MRRSTKAPSLRPALWTGHLTLVVLFMAMLLGGAVGATEGLALCLVLASILLLAWSAAPSPVPMRRLAWPAAGLALTLIVAITTVLPVFPGMMRGGLLAPVGGATLSIAPAATLAEIAKLGGIGCAFVCGVLASGGHRSGARLSILCAGLTTVWAAWSLVLLATTGAGRLGAPFLSPNTAATLLGVGCVLTLGRFLAKGPSASPGRRDAARLAALGGALGVQLFSLLLTQSRAGIAVTLLAMAGLVVATRASGQSRGSPGDWLWGAAAALAALVVAEAGRAVLARIRALADDAGDRTEIFNLYGRAFLDAPAFGSGLGTGSYLTKLGLTPTNYDSLWNVQSAHNWVLQWLAEGGLAGATPMFAAVGVVLWRAVRGLDAATGPLLLPLLFADAVVLGHGLTDFGLQIPALALYWSFLLGLQVAIAERARERAGRARAPGRSEA
jgi:O-antigen ligase